MTSESIKNDKQQTEKDFLRIKTGLKSNETLLANQLKEQVLGEKWKLWKVDHKLSSKDTIDMIFISKEDQKKKAKYVVADVSVPHLLVGQKYSLPAKAKDFQGDFDVPANRVKKAIFLIRKGTETISTRPSRIRCPIIEVSLEEIMPPPIKPKVQPAPQKIEPEPKKDSAKTDAVKTDAEKIEKPNQQRVNEIPSELLTALKNSIINEYLSTMHKRRNKYICKGLWKWVEREILDPNIHFYLVILSSIYQAKTGELLSKKFKTLEQYSNNIEEVISVIFSKENSLADEMKKKSERHHKALNKFLACFSQTPPYEYIKSIFLKDFRTTSDGLKSRMSVFTTLSNLLERCGFEGEKETQYPLEILDELGIFKGLMTGNYSKLRIENALKKLRYLVPSIEWGSNEVYLLRDQLAKALSLPAQEFNLNAFLPQAFVEEVPRLQSLKKEHPRTTNAVSTETKPNLPSKGISAKKMLAKQTQYQKHSQEPASPQPNKPLATDRPIMVPQPMLKEKEAIRTNQYFDESKHRFFENFGGHLEEDLDVVRLAIAMENYEKEQELVQHEKQQQSEHVEDDIYFKPPTKKINQRPVDPFFVPQKSLTAPQSQLQGKKRNRKKSYKDRAKYKRPNKGVARQ